MTIPFIVVRGRLWKESFPLWTTGILVLGTFPAFMDLVTGQDAVLLAFLFAVCYWQIETGRDTGAGVTLGLALIKFQLAIRFLLVLWIAGRKRVLPGFVASASVVVAISAALTGWSALLKYPGYLLARNRSVGVGIAPETQINLRGLLILLRGELDPSRAHRLDAGAGGGRSYCVHGVDLAKSGTPVFGRGFWTGGHRRDRDQLLRL